MEVSHCQGDSRGGEVKVLVACEFSGVVREAFRERGHDAWSCDLIPCSDGSLNHFTENVFDVLNRVRDWDLMIAFPPCTYLAVSGARWWDQRQDEQRRAAFFFETLAKWIGVDKIAVENPIGIMSSVYRKPDQIIQPWMFGHGETKATCLWLKGLPKLEPTNIVEGRKPRVHHESPGIKNGLTRAQRRSVTYQGIADAMAQQWG